MTSSIILALDMATESAVWDLVDRLDPGLCRLKVGKELFTAAGPQLISALRKRGYEIFLDLKFHDIPHTVAQACRVAADLGVWMVDVHASGGPRMLDAARQALGSAETAPWLVAITVLTSMDQADLLALGITDSPRSMVMRLAALAHQCALDGVVCSAQEAVELRQSFPSPFKLVTPGIRLPNHAANDQMRIMTPTQAVLDGVDYLVVGRPITQSPDPLDTLLHFNSLVAGARSQA